MNVRELLDALNKAVACSDEGVERYIVSTSDEYREVPLTIETIVIDHDKQEIVIE